MPRPPLIACAFVLLYLSTSAGAQRCTFRKGTAGNLLSDNSRRSGSSSSSSSSSGSTSEKDSSSSSNWRRSFIPPSECPCFHSESTEEELSACREALPAYDPTDPLLPCSFLPREFVECDEPVDHRGNATARDALGYGCLRLGGGQRWEEVERTSVCCRALDCVECRGNRTFLRHDLPCVRYTDHYFLTTLLYSILLGFIGLDRFCLGKTGTAVGKLLTLGGLGVWWIVDIVLIVTGQLQPEDDSNWVPTV